MTKRLAGTTEQIVGPLAVTETPGPELTGTIDRLERWAADLVVRTSEEAEQANVVLGQISQAEKNVNAFFKDMADKAYSAWKSVTTKRSGYLDRLDAAKKMGQTAVLAYRRAEREKVEAEQRRLQAEIDERARKEREKLERQAERAAASGKTEKAEMLKEQAEAVEAPVVHVETSIPKLAGAAFGERWTARLTSMDELIAAAQDSNSVARTLIQFDQRAADAIAKSRKGAVQVAGVKFEKHDTMASRAIGE